MKLPFMIRYVKSNIAGTSSHIFVMVICRVYLSQEIAPAIFRRNLPQLFAVAFYRVNLSQLFAVGICRSCLPWVYFVYVNKPFFCRSKSFFFVSKSFLFESKSFFYMWAKLFLFIRISLLIMFLSVIAVAVMGHRR